MCPAQIAAEVGYRKTAFVTGAITADGAQVSIRYFAPEVEVDFCGHATIATAVAIGEVAGQGTYTLPHQRRPSGSLSAVRVIAQSVHCVATRLTVFRSNRTC